MANEQKVPTPYTMVIGDREFTCFRGDAFTVNAILIRTQKLVLPVLGGLLESSNGGDLMDGDVGRAVNMIAENLTEDVMINIVFPLFECSRVYDVRGGKFVKDRASMNAAFDASELMDFYELVLLVGRYQFGPFMEKLLDRFGVQIESLIKAKPSQANSPRPWEKSSGSGDQSSQAS